MRFSSDPWDPPSRCSCSGCGCHWRGSGGRRTRELSKSPWGSFVPGRDSPSRRLDGGSGGCGRWWSCGAQGGSGWFDRSSRSRTRSWVPDADAESQRNGDMVDFDRHFETPKERAAYSVFAARLAIMVMFTILITLLTILTWHFTTVYTTRSIKNLAFSLRTELLQRPIARMWNLLNATLDTTVTHVNLSRYVIGQYNVPITPDDQDKLYNVMRNVTWGIFTSRKAVNAMTIIYSNGLTQGFERDSATRQEFYTYSVFKNESNLTGSPVSAYVPADAPSQSASQDFIASSTSESFVWYREAVENSTGNQAGQPVEVIPHNLTAEFGSTLAFLQDGKTNWHVTVHRSDDTPFLASGSPVRHPVTGGVLAVAGVTQALRGVSALMRELVSLHSGTIYLTNADGWLLASSTSSPLLRNTTTGRSLIRPEESADGVIRAGAEWLKNTYGTKLENLQSVHEEDIVLLGKKYYVDTFVLRLSRLQLVGVIVTPRSFVMGAVDRRGHATLAILISVSVGILVIGCLSTLIFTTGVSNEMKLRAELIGHLDARRRAEASSNYKSQFLANMSHELRTPMAAVIGLLDILLCDEYMTSEQVAMVSQIRDCSTALLRLLNNILDLSKVESGKLVLEEAEFDLRRELEGLVDMFSVQCDDRSVEIVLVLADDVPRVLRGDSARTVQVFANLIANSIKFTSSPYVLMCGFSRTCPCAGRVDSAFHGRNGVSTAKGTLRSSRSGIGYYGEDAQSAETICLCFEIDDTGCGIDPSKWESVFDSFVQADPSTTRTYGGTGLGLCIVKSLVNKMGGDIKVVKKEGRGTLMQLSLVFKLCPDLDMPKTYGDYFASTFFAVTSQHCKLLFAVEGRTGGSLLGKWMLDKGVDIVGASTWGETTAELEDIVRDDGLYRALAIVDISLVTESRDLDVLQEYAERGIEIAWLLNHDTSSVTKSDLRKRGFSIMANKPVYKAKLVNLLKMLMSCNKNSERSGEQNCNGDGYAQGVDFSNVGMTSQWRRSSSKTQLLADIQQEVPRGRVVALRANSTGRMEKIVEHTNVDEKPLLTNGHKRRHSEDFPIYKPATYIKPAFLGLGRLTSPQPESETARERSPSGSVHRRSASTTYADVVPKIQQPGFQVGADVIQSLPRKKESTSADNEQVYTQDRSDELHHLDKSWPSDHEDSESVGGADPVQRSVERVEHSVDRKEVARELDSARIAEQAKETVYAAANRPERMEGLKEQQPVASRIGPQDALRGIRILLAEDTPVLQRVATMMLEKLGAKVIAVGDGLQAVNALTQCFEPGIMSERDKTRRLKYLDELSVPYDLVLMDCQMPKLDGYDATKAIRQAEAGTNFHIPIVALTAHAMSSDEAKCLEVGMDAYLTKPIDPKLMMSTIINLTRRQKATPLSAPDSSDSL